MNKKQGLLKTIKKPLFLHTGLSQGFPTRLMNLKRTSRRRMPFLTILRNNQPDQAV